MGSGVFFFCNSFLVLLSCHFAFFVYRRYRAPVIEHKNTLRGRVLHSEENSRAVPGILRCLKL
jgi:hypothetical protein